MTSPRSNWSRQQIRAARVAELPPLLRRYGLRLQPSGADNFHVEQYAGLIVKRSFWRWPERDSSEMRVMLMLLNNKSIRLSTDLCEPRVGSWLPCCGRSTDPSFNPAGFDQGLSHYLLYTARLQAEKCFIVQKHDAATQIDELWSAAYRFEFQRAKELGLLPKRRPLWIA